MADDLMDDILNDEFDYEDYDLDNEKEELLLQDDDTTSLDEALRSSPQTVIQDIVPQNDQEDYSSVCNEETLLENAERTLLEDEPEPPKRTDKFKVERKRIVFDLVDEPKPAVSNEQKTSSQSNNEFTEIQPIESTPKINCVHISNLEKHRPLPLNSRYRDRGRWRMQSPNTRHNFNTNRRFPIAKLNQNNMNFNPQPIQQLPYQSSPIQNPLPPILNTTVPPPFIQKPIIPPPINYTPQIQNTGIPPPLIHQSPVVVNQPPANSFHQPPPLINTPIFQEPPPNIIGQKMRIELARNNASYQNTATVAFTVPIHELPPPPPQQNIIHNFVAHNPNSNNVNSNFPFPFNLNIPPPLSAHPSNMFNKNQNPQFVTNSNLQQIPINNLNPTNYQLEKCPFNQNNVTHINSPVRPNYPRKRPVHNRLYGNRPIDSTRHSTDQVTEMGISTNTEINRIRYDTENVSDEELLYRTKIAEQKRTREEFLKQKEERRLKALQIEENPQTTLKLSTGNLMEISHIPNSNRQKSLENNRVLQTVNIIETNSISDDPSLGLEQKTQPSTNNIESSDATTVRNPINKDRGTSSQGADNKKVGDILNCHILTIAEPTLLNTTRVVLRNLSAGTTKNKIMGMCQSIGEVEALTLQKSERQATIQFQNVASAHLFFKRYQRFMLDLSMIDVKLDPLP